MNKIDNNTVIKVVSVPFTQYFLGDKIEKNEMGGACSM